MMLSQAGIKVKWHASTFHSTLLLFNIFLNDLALENMMIRFTDDPKIGELANLLENHIKHQEDLDKLGKWTETTKMNCCKISSNCCWKQRQMQILTFGKIKLKAEYRKVGTSTCKRTQCGLHRSQAEHEQQYDPAVKRQMQFKSASMQMMKYSFRRRWSHQCWRYLNRVMVIYQKCCRTGFLPWADGC